VPRKLYSFSTPSVPLLKKGEVFTQKLVFAYQRFSYQWLLPILSHLPFFLSENITRLRGCFNAYFDLEWRTIALGERCVKSNVLHAIKKIQPEISNFGLRVKTYQRFITYAREELDAAMFPHRDLKAIFQRSQIEGFEQWEKILNKGKGLVVLTCHYDCFTMGVTLMAMKGYKVNLMTSNAVADPRLSRHVQKFYKDKYQGMEAYFNGGKTVHVEDNLRFFYQALSNNEIVFILADLPAASKENNPKIIAPFINNHYHMAPGPFRMALKTNSQMAGFYCLRQGGGRYHIHCSAAYDPQDLDHTITHLYDFLQQPIKKYPERWFASDLLNSYIADE